MISPDDTKIVRGEGMPRHGESSGKGNLIIRWVKVDFKEILVTFYLFSRFKVEFPPLLDPLVVDALVALLPPKYCFFV